MYLNTQIENLILFALALSALLITSCSDRYEDIPDPNYPPQLLHLGNPIKTNRKQISSHLITAPDTLPYRELYIGPAELKYTAEKTDYQPAGEPGFTLSQAKRVDMDSVAPPLYVPARPKKAPASWPQKEDAQMALVSRGDQLLYQLDTYQGLQSNLIRHLYEDSKGRIWISMLGGGVSVWDGQGLTHFTQRQGLSNNEVKCVLEDRQGRHTVPQNCIGALTPGACRN